VPLFNVILFADIKKQKKKQGTHFIQTLILLPTFLITFLPFAFKKGIK